MPNISMMKIKEKTREQLLKEIDVLKVKIARLEKSAGNDLSKGARYTAPDISKRKNSEIELLKSEAGFRLLYDNSPDMYVSVSPVDGSILLCNDTFLKNTGYEREEILGFPIFNLYHNDCLDEAKKVFQQFVKSGLIRDKELILKKKDGSKIDVSLNINAVRDEKGKILFSVSSWRNITDKKKMVSELRSSKNYLEKLTNSIWDPVFVVKMPERVIEWANESFSLYGYEPHECIGKNTSFLYPDKAGFLSFGNKIKGALAAGKDVLQTNHLLKRKSGEPFLAEVSATFHLENEKLVRVTSIFRDITARRNKEKILQLTQASVDNLTDAVYWMGPDANFSYVNNAAVDALGYSKKELLKMSVHDIDPDFTVELWPAHWADLKEKKSLFFKTLHQRKDKSTFPVEITANFIQFGGRELNCAIARNMTEHKLKEQALQESEDKFSKSFYHHPTPMLIINIETGERIDANNSYVKLTGYTYEELAVGDIFKKNIAFDQKRFNELINMLRTGRDISNENFKLIKKSGKIITTLVSAAKLEIGDKNTAIISFVDITEREKITRKLEESEEQFRTMVEQFPVAIHIFDPEGWTIKVNSAFMKLWDMSEETLQGVKEKFNILHDPVQIELGNMPLIEKAFKGEVVKLPVLEYDAPATLKKLDIQAGSRKRWVNPLLYPVIDENGMVKNVVLIIEDVTEQKEIEKKLSSAHDIINSSPAVAIMWNNENNWPVEYVSKNVIKLFGYSAEELILGDAAYADIIHPDDYDRVVEEVKLAGKNKHSNNFIHKPYRIITKSKKIRWIEDRTTIIRDLKGNITHFQGIVLDITDKISTEKEKEETYEEVQNYKELFEESVNEIYIFDAKSYKFSEVNKSALNNLGYTHDEIKGLTPIDIKPEINKKDFDKLLLDLKNKKKAKLNFNTIHERKNGTTYPVEVHLRLTIHRDKQVFVAIILDITERMFAELAEKKAEQALKDSEYLLRESQEIAHIGSYVLDIQTGTWVGSMVLNELFGIDENYNKDMPGWMQIVHPEDQAIMKDYLSTNVLKNHESFNTEYRIKRINDQQEFWVHGTGELEFDKDGNPMKMIGTIQDITDRKHGEEELAKHREQLEETVKKRTSEIENQSKKLEESQRALTFLLEDVNDARVELEQTNKQIILKNKEMESFTYSVSHDLRAPLRAILGFSNKFTDSYGKFVDKEGKRLLKVINDNTKKMGMLIDDLLDFSRMGRSEMRKVKVDIKGLVNETWNEQKNQFADRKIELTIKDLPIANGDRNMLRQVLFNLLSNAAKFTKNRKISKIEVGFEEKKSETIYYVEDNGVGFDMNYIDKLFQVFQRLHNDREFEGTGVGLAIVQKVIHRHGGKVWAKSTINKGATIYFSLPK